MKQINVQAGISISSTKEENKNLKERVNSQNEAGKMAGKQLMRTTLSLVKETKKVQSLGQKMFQEVVGRAKDRDIIQALENKVSELTEQVQGLVSNQS